MRTHTVTLGSESIAFRVPITARQRADACGDWWSASEVMDDTVRRLRAGEEISSTVATQHVQAVQAGVGAALSRLAPEDHPWRARIRRYAGEGHPTPALAAGLDLVDELADAGVDPNQLAEAVAAILAAVSPEPTQRQVEAVQGNSSATPS